MFCERFKTCFLNENHPEQFALCLHEVFWVLRFTGYGALIILRSAARLCYFALCPLQTTDMQPVSLEPRVLKGRKKVEEPRPPTLKNSRYTQWITARKSVGDERMRWTLCEMNVTIENVTIENGKSVARMTRQYFTDMPM